MDHQSALTQLDVQNNRLTSLGSGLLNLSSLSELYLACNALESLEGLPTNSSLSTLDVSTNRIKELGSIERHQQLSELWMSRNLFETFDAVQPLRNLSLLSCLYLEQSPVTRLAQYRETIIAQLPTLTELDATLVVR